MQLKTILSAALISAFAISAVHARDFRSADTNPPDHPTVMAIKKIGEIISQKTSGKYNVKIFGNGALGSEKDTVELVKTGALDLVRANATAFHNIVPESMLPSFPFIFRDIKHFRATMNGAQGDKILAAFEKSGFIGLVLWESGARSIYAKKPVRTLADVKGMKISAPQSELWISLLQAMGANPTTTTDIYQALKSNQVDAAENSYPAYEAAKHFEVAPVFSETRHIMTPEVLVFSKKIWDTLTREEQKLIREATRESTPYYIEQWSKKEAASRNLAKKAGATVVDDVNRAEFAAVMKPVWDSLSTKQELKDLAQEIVNAK